LALAIYDCVAEFSLVTLPTALAVTGTTVPLMTCFWLFAYGPYVQLNILALMFAISVDRLLAILFPLS
jgi:hypothetical protein